MYGSVVFQSQPWPAGTEGARRLAHVVLITQVAVTVVTVPLIFYVLAVSEHHAGVGGVTAGILLVIEGFFAWLLCHAKKSQAIKTASQLEPGESSPPVS
jgi:hypothetical protein